MIDWLIEAKNHFFSFIGGDICRSGEQPITSLPVPLMMRSPTSTLGYAPNNVSCSMLDVYTMLMELLPYILVWEYTHCHPLQTQTITSIQKHKSSPIVLSIESPLLYWMKRLTSSSFFIVSYHQIQSVYLLSHHELLREVGNLLGRSSTDGRSAGTSPVTS